MAFNTHSPSDSTTYFTTHLPSSPPFDPLAAALSTAQATYTQSNPRSLAAFHDACQYFPGGNTRTVLHLSPFPIMWARGSGARLTSVDGDVFVDFLGEFTAGVFGHSNELIRGAVEEALSKGWGFGGPNEYERVLARKVCAVDFLHVLTFTFDCVVLRGLPQTCYFITASVYPIYLDV